MADWFSLRPADEIPTVPQYILVAGPLKGHRSARYFNDLSRVKLTITNNFIKWGTEDLLNNDVRVYEWDGTGWQEIYFLAQGTRKLEHPLWKNGTAPKVKQVISEVDVSQAVASILGTHPEEG